MSRLRRLVRRAAFAAAAVLTVVVVYVSVTFAQVSRDAKRSEVADARAIVVMGAAQYDGRPSPVLRDRLERGLQLYRLGYAPLIVTTGAKQQGDRFTEGFAGFRYLLEQGVTESDLLVVTTGTDSYEELAATAVELRKIGVPRDARVLVVSDTYHSYRLRHIGDEVGLDVRVAPTDHASSNRSLARETVAVCIGRVIGYRRLSRLIS